MSRRAISWPQQRRSRRTAPAKPAIAKAAASSAKATPAAVDIHCAVAGARAYVRGMRADARELLRLLDVQGFELSVALVGDRAIQELNSRFRGRNRPTDVLSFSPIDDEDPLRSPGAAKAPNDNGLPVAANDFRPFARHPSFLVHQLGDIVISVETALLQSSHSGMAPESRLRMLLIHGLLHLLGYDHEQSRAAARRMFARERELGRLLTISDGRAPVREAHVRATSRVHRQRDASNTMRSSVRMD